MSKTNHQKVLENVGQRIAPVWPLKNFVAVNPYSGFTDTAFGDTAEIMASRGGIQMTMPIGFYLDHIEKGKISRSDIQDALERSNLKQNKVESFLEEAQALNNEVKSSEYSGYNLIDIAATIDGSDWPQLMVDRVSFWSAAHFDEHVRVWNKELTLQDVYKSWKIEAAIDRTPEIMGLSGFRSAMKQLPENPTEFIESFLSSLKLDEEDTSAYLHALLLKVTGWSSYFSGVDFHNKLYEGTDSNLTQFLAVLMTWENYFLNHAKRKDEIRAKWYQSWHKGEPLNSLNDKSLQFALVLQDALDLASQRELKNLFATSKQQESEQKTIAQMAFCIDVRSEVYRRNIEAVDPRIETIGFAGFFGLPIKFVPLGHEDGKNQCPVLIPSSALVKETCDHKEKATNYRISRHQIAKTWKKFKSGAVTSFGFVSPLGLFYLPKILSDSFHVTKPVEDPNVDGLGKYMSQGKSLDLSSIPLEDKVQMTANALTGMGIKNSLAPVVLITGHGSSSVNNPHASGLDCGACGGHSGEINALATQQIFNDPEVRNKLEEQGIKIPKSTIFVACLHDTTTDEIRFINEDWIPESHQELIVDIKKSLQIASSNTRQERSLRFNLHGETPNAEKQIISRGQDWSQVRPEWGLAGCHSFIIAPRKRTSGVSLDGKSFLHNYDWHSDPEFKVLESIITAPMVVTSWINLQYYASTTDNDRFGAGNKTLHNITSGLGVLEGSGGDLRIGLPLQSIHNGEKFEHTPIRLNVVIEAPIEAMNTILEKHDHIRALFDNQWIFLHRMNEHGNITHTYHNNLKWSAEQQEEAAELQESILQKL